MSFEDIGKKPRVRVAASIIGLSLRERDEDDAELFLSLLSMLGMWEMLFPESGTDEVFLRESEVWERSWQESEMWERFSLGSEMWERFSQDSGM